MQEFQIQHRKTTPYHHQGNDAIEALNKILENALTNIYNVQRGEWDHKIFTVLWEYRTIYKNFTGLTPFHWVYGQENVMPMVYIVPSLSIVAIMKMSDVGVVEEILWQLKQLEEDRFVEGYHQNIEK